MEYFDLTKAATMVLIFINQIVHDDELKSIFSDKKRSVSWQLKTKVNQRPKV